MNWKNWPYWVKGAFTGFVMSVGIFLLMYSWETYPLWAVLLILFSAVPGFILSVLSELLVLPGSSNPFPNFFGIIAYANNFLYIHWNNYWPPLWKI